MSTTKKQVPQPMPDVSKKHVLWSAKWQCTFYGNSIEDCHRQLLETESRRDGSRFLNPKSSSFTLTEKSADARKK